MKDKLFGSLKTNLTLIVASLRHHNYIHSTINWMAQQSLVFDQLCVGL